MSNLENVAAFAGTSAVSSCGSTCGAADPKPEENPASACGSACGAGDPKQDLIRKVHSVNVVMGTQIVCVHGCVKNKKKELQEEYPK